MTDKVCENPECLTLFATNKRGATSKHCARCNMHQRRNGRLPGPKREYVPTDKHTVVLPEDFPKRIAKVSNLPISTWVRLAAETRLLELETKLLALEAEQRLAKRIGDQS